ncbi:MAG: radical SAM protein [Nitrospirales bacterium]|nr:radical SAM protein [Nitrospirales bacterium]
MKILIISTNQNRLPMPVIPMGACMVAEAAERAGHSVTLLDLMFERNPVSVITREVSRLRPDLVGFSVRNIDDAFHSPAAFISDLLPLLIGSVRKTTSAPIVLGGAAVPVMPEELLRYTGATCAVLGGGETVFPELIGRLTSGGSIADLPGVAWIKDGLYRENEAALHDAGCSRMTPDLKRWLDMREYLARFSSVPVQTKLGCRFSCVYCTYRKIEGSSYRLSSAVEVLDTVRDLSSKGLRSIEFVDNVFNYPYSHGFEVCEALASARPKASFQCLELNPLYMDDPFVSVMERAGFRGIGITVESASDRVLSGLGKGFSSDHVHRAAEVVRRHDLPCLWIFMMGGPNETEETVKETLEFAEHYIRPQDAAYFGMGIRIYPGTGIEEIARQQGLLSASPTEMLKPVFYLSPGVDHAWLQSQVRQAMGRRMNFINSDFMGNPVLGPLQKIGYTLGLRPPAWRYMRFLRRCLSAMGMER